MTIKTGFIRYSLISILIQIAIPLSISADEFERRANPNLDFVYLKKTAIFHHTPLSQSTRLAFGSRLTKHLQQTKNQKPEKISTKRNHYLEN